MQELREIVGIVYSLIHLPEMYVHEQEIEQVILNVLLNAICYSTTDGKDILVELSESGGSPTPDWTMIDIINWGVGVPEKEKESIFQAFYRGSNVREFEGSIGTGLGLTISKSIIEAHNGKIVLSELINPTRFSICLPNILRERRPSL